MENPPNRRARRARRARRGRLRIDSWADVDASQAPLIIIQTTILSFFTVVVFLTPILVSCYATYYAYATELKLFYKLIIYPLTPNFPHSEVVRCCVEFLNSFLVTTLVLFIIVVWRTMYLWMQLIVELLYNGQLFLL
ncbi:unnamed protein product [Macrosiphum euphorbiae]|uniref:Uncharacterized protein n=1 Tax=Macrosiphum euphorbiae TaxID=13131 RepID=A0AAV0WCJ7_9HEMI|nr:unnamed protein product [Macrosiphum euphorbiae]